MSALHVGATCNAAPGTSHPRGDPSGGRTPCRTPRVAGDDRDQVVAPPWRVRRLVLVTWVETRGIEPLTPALQTRVQVGPEQVTWRRHNP